MNLILLLKPFCRQLLGNSGIRVINKPGVYMKEGGTRWSIQGKRDWLGYGRSDFSGISKEGGTG